MSDTTTVRALPAKIERKPIIGWIPNAVCQGSFRLGTTAFQLMLLAMSKIPQNAQTLKAIFSVGEFMRAFNKTAGTETYLNIKSAVMECAGTAIRLKTADGKWGVAWPFFQECLYYNPLGDKDKHGVNCQISLEFNPKFWAEMSKFKGHARIDFDELSKLKSPHANRLLSLVVSWDGAKKNKKDDGEKDKGKRTKKANVEKKKSDDKDTEKKAEKLRDETWCFSYATDELRDVLGILANDYSDKEFTRACIGKQVKYLNENTKTKVKLTTKKEGRRVVRYEFECSQEPKKQANPAGADDTKSTISEPITAATGVTAPPPPKSTDIDDKELLRLQQEYEQTRKKREESMPDPLWLRAEYGQDCWGNLVQKYKEEGIKLGKSLNLDWDNLPDKTKEDFISWHVTTELRNFHNSRSHVAA